MSADGKVSGIVLAGGKGSRMGGVDKGLQPLRGKPMVAWAIARLKPQVDEIVINANQNLEIYGALGYRVVSDEIGGFAGPLAGLHAGLAAATYPLSATVPCDSPFLPADLILRLRNALNENDLAVAKTGGQAHPVFVLLRTSLRKNLEGFLKGGGRKIDAWTAQHRTALVPFDRAGDATAFSNANTLAELHRLEQRP